ncbi:S8 family serine peptidase [Sulfidibacter corallicola]|uniref:S8 family serine peptidase n=1 Tax=Sulfidibacter corallicola TaxID=2818388 RepID=A0A8A4TMR9_SULCO|nr:S8 family serine peptidase [Sulfidibacter corallicola]QTD50747.1 S8 family serine peptidase [Sulfidibacter corallicola]
MSYNYFLLILLVGWGLAADEITCSRKLGPALRIIHRYTLLPEKSKTRGRQNWVRHRVAALTGYPPAFSVSGDAVLPVVLDYHGDPARLALSGFHAQARIGSVHTGTIAAGRLSHLIALEGLDNARMSRVMSPGNQQIHVQSRLESEKAPLVGGAPLDMDVGAGVIVAYLDTGVDITHRDFRNEDGSTRIIYILDLSLPGDTDGDGILDGNGPFGGTLFSRAQIDQALSNTEDFPSVDTTGHGTHGLSIAAGSNPLLPGLAPGADLIVVKATRVEGTLDFHSIDVINGMAFIDEAAGGQPYVINLSLGTIFGNHDGSAPEEAAVDALTGVGKPGKAVVIAAGNASQNKGDRFRHIVDKAFNGLSNEHVLHIPPYTEPMPGEGNDLVVIHLVYEANDALEILLTAPDEEISLQVGAFAHISQTTEAGHIFMSTMGANGGARQAVIMISEQDDVTPAAGHWHIRVQGSRIGEEGLYHGWLSESSMVGGGFPRFVAPADNSFLIGKPAGAFNGIAVGSHAHHDPGTRFVTQWIDINGRSRVDQYAVPGSISSFSSPGPTRDGRIKPDITAPGELVLGAVSSRAMPLSSPFSMYRNHNLEDPQALLTAPLGQAFYAVSEGTSFAAPVVTGLAARLLSRSGDLDSIQIRNMLRHTALADKQTGSLPNGRWGYGKVSTDLALDPAIPLPSGLFIETVSLPTTAEGSQYRQSLRALGGSAPYRWSLIEGTLPPGLTLGTGGLISGMCVQPGTYDFVVRVTDKATPPLSEERPFQLKVHVLEQPEIVSRHLGDGRLNRYYSGRLEARGGAAPLTWSLQGGKLPPGLTLKDDGSIEGIPIETGLFAMTLGVTDMDGAGDLHSFTLDVFEPGDPDWYSLGNQYLQISGMSFDPTNQEHLLTYYRKSLMGYIKESWDDGDSWQAVSYMTASVGDIWGSGAYAWIISPLYLSMRNLIRLDLERGSFGVWSFCNVATGGKLMDLTRTSDGRTFVLGDSLICSNPPFSDPYEVIYSELDTDIWHRTEPIDFNLEIDPSTREGNISIFDPNPDHIYVSFRGRCQGDCDGPGSNQTYRGRLFYSADHGNSWQMLQTPLPLPLEVTVSRNDPADVLAFPVWPYYNNVLFRSLDHGSTWQIISIPYVQDIYLCKKFGERFVATTDEGMFSSNDGGATWTEVMIPGINDIPSILDFHPLEPLSFYVYVESQGILKTEDGGLSWKSKNGGLLDVQLNGMAIDRSDPDSLFVSSVDKGIYLTRTDGKKWVSSQTGFQNYNYGSGFINTLPVILETDPNVYVLKNPNGFWVSKNRGLEWFRPNLEFGNRNVVNNGRYGQVVDFAIDPNDSSIIARLVWVYPGNPAVYEIGGLWVSEDMGETWNEIPDIDVPPDPYQSLLFHSGEGISRFSRARPGTFYTLGQDGLYVTEDRGQQWSFLKSLGPHFSYTLEISDSAPHYIYVGGLTGVMAYDPIIDEWHHGTASRIKSLVVSPNDPTRAMAGLVGRGGNTGFTEPGGLILSEDAGRSWSTLATILDHQSISSLISHPTRSGTYYAATHQEGAFRSTDDGQTWEKLIDFGTVSDLVNVSAALEDTLLIGTRGYGVQLSVDGGKTFLPSSNGLLNHYINALLIDTEDNQTVYAGTDKGLFISDDLAASWSPTTLTTPQIADIAIDRGTKPRRIYLVSLTDGFIYSNDGGQTYTTSSSGLPTLRLTGVELQEKAYGNRIWVSMIGGDGIAWSDNKGLSWNGVSGHGSHDRWVLDIMVDPALHNRLWIAGISGVFYTDNDGEHWHELDHGLPAGVPVTSLSFDPLNGDLLASLYSEVAGGVHRLGGLGKGWRSFQEGLTEPLVSRLSRPGHPSERTQVGTRPIYAATAGKGLFSSLLAQPSENSPSIITATLPEGTTQATYKSTLSASGGNPPLQWAVIEGTLPPGLGLNPDSGIISGNPVVAGSFLFEVQVTDVDHSKDQKSLSLEISAKEPPLILQSPSDTTACESQMVIFQVTARGSAPLSYQWRKNGLPINAADGRELILGGIESFDAGTYDCVVTNPHGSMISSPTSLTVVEPVTITEQPTGQIICPGEDLVWCIGVNGADPFQYQWYHNDSPIPGAQASCLSIDEVSLGDEGSYYCVVTNPCGQETSVQATMTVGGPLRIRISSPGARGLDPPVLQAFAECAQGPVTFTWQNLTTGDTSSLNPFELDPPPKVTTTYGLSASDKTETVTEQTTILVALNALYLDLDGDGCNTLRDLHFLILSWRSPNSDDVNGDGFIDVRDLLYINTSEPAPCDPKLK